jgi:hypothetical protein
VVVAVHMGYVDTDATRGIHAPKVSAAKVAEKTMDAITRNDPEVLVDQTAQRVRFLLSGPWTCCIPRREQLETGAVSSRFWSLPRG